MAEVGDLRVRLSLDNAQFERSVASMNRTLQAMGQEIRGLQNRGKDWGNSIEGLRQKQDAYGRLLEGQQTKVRKLSEEHEKAKQKYGEHSEKAEKLAVQLNRASAEMDRTERELSEITAELQRQQRQLEISQTSWYRFGEVAQQAGAKLKAVGDKMSQVGKELSMKLTAPIVALGTGAFKAAVDFESAFAGVRKTVDATEEEFQTLSDGIRDMAKRMPTAATEIAAVGEAAGQLGIQKENILGFTETMVKLGTATNMSSDEAATALARLANITQMNQADFDKLGSAIVALGNNFATTESEITEMALRLAGAGAQVGLSEADILGLSAALTSVGIQAEMGGSAFSRVMVNMQMATSSTDKLQAILSSTGLTLRELQMMASHSGKAFGNLAEDLGMTKQEFSQLVSAGADLENFAKIAGMTAQEFKKAFETDAVGAIGAFVNGLGNAEQAGTTAINMLQEMGITEIQLRDALLRAGGAAELFTDAVETSNTGWKENNALNKEAEERYKTTASQMTIMLNKIKDLGITIGSILIPVVISLMDAVSPLIEKFSNMEEGTQKVLLAIGGIVAAIGPVLVVFGMLISSIGSIAGVLGSVSLAVANAGGMMTLLGTAFTALTGPIGLTVGAITAVGVGVGLLVKHFKESSIEVEDWTDKVSESTAEAVSSFMNLSDEASGYLTTLSITGQVVTQEMASNITNTFSQMGQQVLEEMRTDHAEQLNAISSFYANSNVLIESEEAEILAKTAEYQANKEKQITDGNARINEIMNTASNEKRALTLAEEAEISRIHAKMKENAVKYMTESQLEQQVIFETMKNNASEISAQQAAEVVQNSVKQKEQVVAEAQDQYSKAVAEIIKQRDEMGVISAQQAKQLIEDAGKQRDEVIKAAEDMHKNVVTEAQKQAGEHVEQVNWETGEIKSKWEIFKSDISKKSKEIGANIKKDWSQAYADAKKSVNDMANSVSAKFSEMGKAVGIKMNEAKSFVVKKWNEAVSFLKGINLYQIGIDIIQGLINGIGSMASAVWDKAKEVAKGIGDSIKNVLGIRSPSREMMKVGAWTGEGLAIGIEKTKQTNKNAINSIAKVIKDVTQKNAKEVTIIAEKAEKERTKIQQTYANKRNNLKKADGKKLAQLEKEMQDKLKEVNEKAWAEMIKKEGEASKQKLEAIQKFMDAKKKANELSLIEEAQYWRVAYQQFATGSAENLELRQSYQENVKRINDAIANVNNEYLAKAQKINDDLIKNEEEANKKYSDALESKYQTILGYYGLFDAVTKNDPVEKFELSNNLESQVASLKDWASQIEQLKNRKISANLLTELKEMGPKAIEQLRALNSMTDAELKGYENLYKEKMKFARETAIKELEPLKAETQNNIQAMRDAAAKELESLNNDWKQAIKDVVNGTDKELKTLHQVGKNAGEGLLKGLSSMQDALAKKAKEIANTISKTIKGALQINSPSKLMAQYGKWTGEGLAVGMDNSIDIVKKAANGLATMTSQAIETQVSLDTKNQQSMLNGLAQVITASNQPFDMTGLTNLIGQIANRPVELLVNLDGQTIARTVSTNQYNSASLAGLTKGVSMG